jgi:hypothetical protein
MKIARDLALNIPPIRRLRDARDSLLTERDRLLAELQQARTNLATRQSDQTAATSDTAALLASAGSPFFHFNHVFDAHEVIRRHEQTGCLPHAGYLTNFLGVLIDPKFFPQLLDGRGGEVEGPPIPGNWHADMAEFAAALRAVDLARDSFTMIELGCGWGCWMNNTGTAAKRRGLDVQLIGVEGDVGHIGFARDAFKANGFQPSQVHLYRGVAAAASGVALFPKQDRAGVAWGLQPVFGATDAQRQQAVRSGDYDELPMIALAEVAEPFRRIDFLHIDIQGGEADLIEGCLAVLRNKVAYLFVGTHSRQIEGRLFDTLLREGWRLEIERPGLLKLDGDTPYMWIDGVQGWRNPRLLPDDGCHQERPPLPRNGATAVSGEGNRAAAYRRA